MTMTFFFSRSAVAPVLLLWLCLGAGGQQPDPIVENGASQGIAGGAGASGAAVAGAVAADAKLPSGKDVFDLLDANHDGRMDRKEFQRAVDQFEDFLRHHPSDVERTKWWAKPAAGSVPHKDLGFWNGFTSAVAMILATEIGDKTFFIAAVLSMKQDRRCVFGGAIFALVLMTVLSTFIGLLLPQFLDRKYTHFLAGALFGYFGLRLLWESRSMASHKVSEELEEVEEEILHQRHKKKGDSANMDDSCNGVDSNTEDESNNSANIAGSSSKVDLENPMRNRGGNTANGFASPGANTATSTPKSPSKTNKKNRHHRSSSHKRAWHLLLLQSFTLTFVAEWGDRSQIATIALAAAKNPWGVTLGGCIGHSICTGLAVVGGRMLAAKISEKTVSQWGGTLFLLFGIHSLFFES